MMNKNEYKGSEKMEKKFGTFRKATFGGFNRKDVISYIEKIKNETFEYRCQVEDTIKKLNEKIIELEGALVTDANSSYISGKGEITIPSGEGYTDIKDATQHLREVADELCSSLGDFIEKLSQRGLCDSDFTPSADISSAVEEESPTDVESILSSIAFLNEAETKTETDEKNQGSGTAVGDILSSLSFLY